MAYALDREITHKHRKNFRTSRVLIVKKRTSLRTKRSEKRHGGGVRAVDRNFFVLGDQPFLSNAEKRGTDLRIPARKIGLAFKSGRARIDLRRAFGGRTVFCFVCNRRVAVF